MPQATQYCHIKLYKSTRVFPPVQFIMHQRIFNSSRVSKPTPNDLFSLFMDSTYKATLAHARVSNKSSVPLKKSWAPKSDTTSDPPFALTCSDVVVTTVVPNATNTHPVSLPTSSRVPVRPSKRTKSHTPNPPVRLCSTTLPPEILSTCALTSMTIGVWDDFVLISPVDQGADLLDIARVSVNDDDDEDDFVLLSVE